MDILRCVVLCPPWYLRVAIFLSLSCCGVCYLMSCCGVCYLQPAPPTQSLFQFASHTLDPTPSICYRHPKIFPALFLCRARIAVAKEHSNGDGRRATAATVAFCTASTRGHYGGGGGGGCCCRIVVTVQVAADPLGS